MTNIKKASSFKYQKVLTSCFLSLFLFTMNNHLLANPPSISIDDETYKVMLDDEQVDLEVGIKYSTIKNEDSKGLIRIYISDKEPPSDTKFIFTLVSKGLAQWNISVNGNQDFHIKPLLSNAKKGDVLNIEIQGIEVKKRYLNIPIN